MQWEGQKVEAMQKLRDRLDSEFKYLGNTLSMQGFKNFVKRFLKSERSRLKAKFLEGEQGDPCAYTASPMGVPKDILVYGKAGAQSCEDAGCSE